MNITNRFAVGLSVTKQRIEWNGEARDIVLPEFEITELNPGHYLVSGDNTTFEIFEQGRTFGTPSCLSDGQSLDGIEVKIESARERIIRERFQGNAVQGTVRTGVRVVKAPMPGLVRSVKVAEGDVVESHSTLLVLEAMKMENNILAGAKGKILKVLADQGSSVDKNASLIEIELI
jgi:biotin carboxyl carrier protein